MEFNMNGLYVHEFKSFQFDSVDYVRFLLLVNLDLKTFNSKHQENIKFDNYHRHLSPPLS